MADFIIRPNREGSGYQFYKKGPRGTRPSGPPVSRSKAEAKARQLRKAGHNVGKIPRGQGLRGPAISGEEQRRELRTRDERVRERSQASARQQRRALRDTVNVGLGAARRFGPLGAAATVLRPTPLTNEVPPTVVPRVQEPDAPSMLEIARQARPDPRVPRGSGGGQDELMASMMETIMPRPKPNMGAAPPPAPSTSGGGQTLTDVTAQPAPVPTPRPTDNIPVPAPNPATEGEPTDLFALNGATAPQSVRTKRLPKLDDMPFAKAFSTARKAGRADFPWRGKMYSTRLATESPAQFRRKFAQ